MVEYILITFQQAVYSNLGHNHFIVVCFSFSSTCFSAINILISEHIEATICCKVQQMSLWKTIFQGLLQQFPMH